MHSHRPSQWIWTLRRRAHERVVKGKAKGGTFAPMDTSADNFSEGEYDSDASSAVYRSEDEGDKDGAPVGGKKVLYAYDQFVSHASQAPMTKRNLVVCPVSQRLQTNLEYVSRPRTDANL